MDRLYFYLVPFKPEFMKKKSIEQSLCQDGAQISLIGKNFGSIYPCARITSDHPLASYMITGKLEEYGEVIGNVSEYTYTSEAKDLPSRPLKMDEQQILEKDLRKGYTSGDLVWIIALGVFTISCAVVGITSRSLLSLLLAVAFLAAFVISIVLHKRAKKEAAEMQFNPEEWTAIDCTVCNSWSEDKVEKRIEDGKEVTQTYTYYYHELAAGNYALTRRFDGRMQIGNPVTIFYNVKDNWVKNL